MHVYVCTGPLRVPSGKQFSDSIRLAELEFLFTRSEKIVVWKASNHSEDTAVNPQLLRFLIYIFNVNNRSSIPYSYNTTNNSFPIPSDNFAVSSHYANIRTLVNGRQHLPYPFRTNENGKLVAISIV